MVPSCSCPSACPVRRGHLPEHNTTLIHSFGLFMRVGRDMRMKTVRLPSWVPPAGDLLHGGCTKGKSPLSADGSVPIGLSRDPPMHGWHVYMSRRLSEVSQAIRGVHTDVLVDAGIP